jgi:hypothetical protein
MAIDQKYAERIRKETGLFANWEPNSPRAIGDFGPVKGSIFEFFGRLNDEEIGGLGERESPSAASYDIMIHASRAINANAGAKAKASVASGKALLEMKFTSEDGIAFSAPDVTIVQITNLPALGDTLKRRRLNGAWDTEHAVVVQVNRAPRATIVLSDEAGAQIDFEIAANVPVNAQLIANLDAGASLLSARGVGVRIVGQGPLVPLFKLAYLKKRLFGDPRIVYRDAEVHGVSDRAAPEVYEVDDELVLTVF